VTTNYTHPTLTKGGPKNGVRAGLALDFHTEIGFSLAAAIALPVGSMLLAAAYYFALRAWRRRRGVDLDLLYKTIPPD